MTNAPSSPPHSGSGSGLGGSTGGPRSQSVIPQRIGPYPIDRELGRGGMGVVYLARDPRLGRPIAIKVLPEVFSNDPARLQRFEREAKTLATLSHANVGLIYGLEEVGQQRLLVLEYIPGVTLSKLLDKAGQGGGGGLPLEEALRICVQVAEGLEAAHERDIVHRDLKPDNIKVTPPPESTVKILDFGLATTGQAQQLKSGSIDPDEMPTVGPASHLTQQGMIMGTPGYMSPEQARGQPIDKRTDIWAFGCVLFECLCGHRAFDGETPTDSMAAVIDKEPDWSLLPPPTPSRIREILRRCLIKDARKRLRDIGDARIEIEEVLSQPMSGMYRATGGGGDPGKPRPVARLALPLPSGLALSNATKGALAIAPDGSSIALVLARPGAAETQLHVRSMDDPEPRPLPGTIGADGPFYSTDGQKVGFFEGGKLKTIPIVGGAPTTHAPAPRHQGGCWDANDHILFVPDWQRGVSRIGAAAAGGTPATIAEPDMAGGELAHMSPETLPGGRAILVAAWTGSGLDDAVISAIDLRNGARKPLISGGANPRYAASGHIVFARKGSLMAVAFDPERLEVLGQPQIVIEGVLGNALGGASQFALGSEGTLVYAPGGLWEPEHSLLRVPRAGVAGGEPSPALTDKRPLVAPAISPDGRHIAAQVLGPTDHIWVFDLDRAQGAGTRLTFHADNAAPVWSPDGTRIAFRSTMGGKPEIYWTHADGSGAPELLHSGDLSPTPCVFAPDGRSLLFTQGKAGGAGGLEIWRVPVDGHGAASLVMQTPMSAWGASVSPNGRYIAYTSDQTGRAEVYVAAFDQAASSAAGGRWQVSGEGGCAPVWAPDGGELFYRPTAPPADTIISVRVAIEPVFQVGRPRPAAQGPFIAATTSSPNYAIHSSSAGSQHVLVVRREAESSPVTELNVVLNWFEELKRRVPVPQISRTAHGTRVGPPTPRPARSSRIGTLG